MRCSPVKTLHDLLMDRGRRVRFATVTSGIALLALLGCSDREASAPTCMKPDTNSITHEFPVSAARSPFDSWASSLARQTQTSAQEDPTINPLANPRSVAGSARPYRSDFDFSRVPEWTGTEEELLVAFRAARDERKYSDSSRPDFRRRALWLYPYNGCFVRATHTAKTFESLQLQRPGKVFVFGDLRLKTPYERNGWVYWSYHVATAFRFKGKVLVLDAGVDHLRPITFEDWITRIADDASETKVNVCDTWAYSPMNPCWEGRPSQERSAEKHLVSYLSDEWARLKRAGYAPERVLGDRPPWTEIEDSAQPSPVETPAPTPAPVPPVRLEPAHPSSPSTLDSRCGA